MASVPAMSVNTADPTEKHGSRVDQLIDERLKDTAAAIWRADLVRAGLQLFAVAIGGLLLWVMLDHWVYSPGPLGRGLALLAGTLTIVIVGWIRLVPLVRSKVQLEYAALALERDVPELRQGLLSYVSLRASDSPGGLRSSMLRSLGASTAQRIREYDRVPSEASGTMPWWFTALGLALILASYATFAPKNVLQSAQRLVTPLASIAAPKRVAITDVQPGDATTVAGKSLDVSARIAGLGQDELASLRWTAMGTHHEAELVKDPQTNRYTGQLQLDHFVTGRVSYEIHAGDAFSGPYHLSVDDVPTIVSQSVRYEPPAYTQRPAHVQSGGSINGLSGTRVTVMATTNRPVKRAKFEFNPRPIGDSMAATAGSSEMQISDARDEVSFQFTLKSSQGRAAAVDLDSYRIVLWDDADHISPTPVVHPIKVIEDLPPEVTIVVPQTTPKEVPIDAQQIVEVHALDPDFGLTSIELVVQRGIDRLANPVLWKNATGATGNQIVEYRFRPAEHNVRVGDVIAITAVAADNRASDRDPSVEPNYSKTDPVHLKITMGQTPTGAPEQNDGLSTPDDQPSGDVSKGDGQEQGDQGSGGGSGSGASSSSKQSDQGGATAGGQSQGKGDSAPSNDPNSGGQGSGNQNPNDPKNQSPNSQGPNSQGPNSQGTGEGASPEGASNDPSDTSNANRGDGQSPNPADNAPGQSNANQQQPQDATNRDNSSRPEPNAAPDAGVPNGGVPNEGAQSEGGPGESADGQSAGNPSPAGNRGSNDSAGQSQTAGEKTAGEKSADEQAAGDKSNPGDSDSQPPQHDGEAFERIQDYLNQKRGESNPPTDSPKNQPAGSPQSGEKGGQHQPGTNNQSPQGQKPDGSQPSPSQPSAGERGSENTKNDPASQAADDPGAGTARDPGMNQNSANESGKPAGEAGKQRPDVATNQDASKDGSGEKGSQPSDPASDRSSAPDSSDSSPSSESSGGDPNQGPDESAADQPRSGPQDSSQERADQAGSNQKGSQANDSKSGRGNESDSPQPSQPSSKESGEKTGAEGTGEGMPAKPSAGQNGKESSANGPANDPSGTGSEGGGSGSGSGSDVTAPVDAPDLEYTKRASDMVLDYLRETRDAPDRELLEKMNWSEEQLRQFSDRWQNLRESNPDAPLGENRQWTEALESLGMRPGGTVRGERQLEQDALRGLRDTGNRQPPPAAFRDAFDAFRRAASRSQ